LKPSAGTGSIAGAAAGSFEARRVLSWLSDTPVFYDDLSVREHLHYIAGMHGVVEWEEKADGLLDAVGLLGRADDLPTTFSRGLRQKAALTLALIRPFRLLLVDEPFVGLDEPGKGALLRLLHEASDLGATLVVATHELGFVQEVDRLIALRDGAVIFDGAPADADVHALVLPV
jgi:ABC-2 type transport system ATP-binding protein